VRIWSSLIVALLAIFTPALAHRRGPSAPHAHARRPKTPAPDPNIGLAQRQQADLASRQQQFFETNFAPRYMQQMDDQIALGRRQVDLFEKQQGYEMDRSKRFDDRYWGTQVKVEDELIDRARKYNEEGEQERMAGTAGADVAQSFGLSRQNIGREMARRGMGSSSNAGIAALMDNSSEEALARAGAMNMTREAARQMGWSRLGEAAALGRGLPGFGAQSSQLAMSAGQGALGAGASGMGAISAASGGFNANTSTVGNLWNNVGQLGIGSDRNRFSQSSGGGGIGSLVGGIAGSFLGPMGSKFGSMAGGALGKRFGLGE
jgi:hypothetical protein